MAYLYTVKKDIPDVRDHLVPPPAPSVTIPASTDLSQYLGPVKDQGQLGSCTAHAGTECRESLYRQFYKWEHDKTVAPAEFRLSPLFFYGQERELEGDFNQDNGAQSRTMMQVMSLIGCCLESTCPYDVSKAFVAPGANLFEEAAKYKNTSYHRVLDIATAKSVLASGYLVTLGMPVFDSFESDAVAKSGKVPMPGSKEQNLGGHEVIIWGHDDNFFNVDGTRGAFKVRNSWGAGWGDKGNFYLPYQYLFTYDGQWDMWTAHLGKPWK